MAYKLVFIDEEKDQHNDFKDYMDAAGDQFVLECLYPEPDMESMINRLEECHPDAIVSDFLLNDIKEDIQYNVSYNGAELVQEYRAMRPDFPCFVITSHDNDAVPEVDDVNLVYVKGLLTDGEKNNKVKFYDKIKAQIDKYKSAISVAQKEFNELLDKRKAGTMDMIDEERLVDLDNYLEKSLDNHTALPSQLKSSDNLRRMTSALDDIESLLSKLN